MNPPASTDPSSPAHSAEAFHQLNDELRQQAADLSAANQNLIDSEQRLRLALDTGKIGLWVWNSTDVTNAGDWSPRLREIFGIPLDVEVTHELFLSCVHPEDREAVNEAVMSAIGGASGGYYRAEYRAVRANDGAERWVTARGRAFFNPDGSPFRFIGTVMDVTEVKQAEASWLHLHAELESRIRERTSDLEQMNQMLQTEIEVRKQAEREMKRTKNDLRIAVDTVPGLVWSTLPDGFVEYLNRRWLDYTGLTLEQASGWGWQSAVHPEDLEGLVVYWTSILSNEVAGEYEARLRRFDGVYRWFLFRGVPLRDDEGKVVKWYGTNTDIDAMRTSEHVVRGQLHALTHMLEALSQENDPDQLLEHVARLIQREIGADNISFWSRNEEDVMDRLATFENDVLQYPVESATAAQVAAVRNGGHPVWTEFFRTGTDCVEGEFTHYPPRFRLLTRENAEWHSSFQNSSDPVLDDAYRRLAETGVVSTVTVPMLISGRVEGIISARFMKIRRFRPEEIELIKALGNQAMLVIQMMRLAKQGRHAAVISERNRLARDIHDTLAQGFTGVIVQLEASEDARARGFDEEADQHISRARELARESLQEARRSVHALRPQALAEQSLAGALRELLKKMTSGTPVLSHFLAKGTPIPMPPDCEDNLLRICQEVLTNTLRHAAAKQFTATLVFSDNAVCLDLCDDGRGFDLKAHSEGFGLVGMSERVQSMGGKLTVQSSSPQGTSIRVQLPLPEARA